MCAWQQSWRLRCVAVHGGKAVCCSVLFVAKWFCSVVECYLYVCASGSDHGVSGVLLSSSLLKRV